jgi:hypothetical protein
MTLEIRLRRFSFLPGLIQAGNGDPRWAHFLGRKQATQVDKQDQGQQDDNNPKKRKTGKYRPLGSITLGEVDDALRHYLPQMVASPVDGWISRNYFCQLPVRQQTEDQSPVMFGRVKTCFPGDGNVHNIDQMELYFPNIGAGPDLLNIRRSDIHGQRPMQSYCVGVKMYLSEAEREDFRRSENIFIEKGFAPLYETGYLDLLDMNEQDFSSLLWLNVIGSEWFASIPDSIQPEIRERLRLLADWNMLLLNYHPKRHALRHLSLNDELDFSYGYTKHFLITPQDTNQVLQKIDRTFGEIFMQAMQ